MYFVVGFVDVMFRLCSLVVFVVSVSSLASAIVVCMHEV